MELIIETRDFSQVTILDISGQIIAGHANQKITDAIREKLVQGTCGILINLKAVSYIDPVGLGNLILCYLVAKKCGCKIKLIFLKNSCDLIQLVKLLTIFEMFYSESKALISFEAFSR